MSIEAMKLALEALETAVSFDIDADDGYYLKAITALRQAIEQAEKQCQCPACKIKPHASDCSVHNEPAWPNGPCDCGAVEQAQKQEPVTYPENFIDALRYDTALRDFEHEQAQKQEPVAWMHWLHGPVRLFLNKDEAMMELDRLNREYPVDADGRKMRPLVFGDTSPPQRQPLTDEQARAIIGNVANIGDGLRIARAIEAAHGIKENT